MAAAGFSFCMPQFDLGLVIPEVPLLLVEVNWYAVVSGPGPRRVLAQVRVWLVLVAAASLAKLVLLAANC